MPDPKLTPPTLNLKPTRYDQEITVDDENGSRVIQITAVLDEEFRTWTVSTCLTTYAQDRDEAVRMLGETARALADLVACSTK